MLLGKTLENSCSDHWKAQAIWLKNTLLLPQWINGDRPHFVRKRTFSYRKWGLSPFILKASLFSPPERNRARSAFLTVFSPYSLRQAREPDRFGQRVTHPPSLWWGQTLSLFWGTGYFLSCGHHLQVKSDHEGARLFPKTYALAIV